MSHSREKRHALQQAAGLLFLAAAAGATGGWWAARPDGPDEIRIAAGVLRSHSAELKLLSQQADRKLPPRFVRAHAGQLARVIEDTRDDVDGLKPSAAWLPLAGRLQPVARELAREARALQARPRTRVPEAAGEPSTEALARTEQALKR